MKLFVSLIFLLSITAAFGFSLEGPDAYCRQNPRRTGETIALNRPAFSWLLTCPSGAPLASPININFTEVGELDLSYYNRNSPSRRDQEVLLFESAFTNGAIDPRQGACISWEHAFKPNSKAFILSTGSGLPVIVSLDRRYYDGPTESETIRGSFLYSRCNDAACTSATTPKPFWGRRIGEPLFQDTMAELAYFPIDPDWAYNSPVLGAVGTLDRRENMLSKLRRAREGFDSLPGDYPSDIAHTHVWSATGEKILVVVAPGIRDLNKTGADWYLTWCQEEDCDSWGIMKLKHPVEDPEQNRKQDFNDLQTSRFFEDVNQEQDLHSRAAVTTSADGRSIIVSIGGYVQEYKLRSLHANPRFRYEAMQSIYSEMTRPRLMNPRAPRSENDINEQNFYFGVDFAIWDGLTFEDYHPLNAAYGGRGNEFLNLLSEPIQNRFAVGCADLEEYGIHADPWCTWNYYWEQTMSVSCGNSTDSGRLAGKGHADLVTDCNTGDVYLLASPFGDATNDYKDSSVRKTRIRQSSYMTVVPVSPKNGICGAPVEEWPKVTTDLAIGKRTEYRESELDVMVYPTPSRRPSGYLKPDRNTLRPVQGLDLALTLDSPGRGVRVGDAETGRRFNAVQGGNGLPFFTWADLNAGLQDAAQVWGTCAFESTNTFSCRTIFDSIELGTMGFLPGLNGRTILLQAPDKLPVMVYWFDHFGGYSNGAMADASLPIAPGQVTNKPLIIACTDYRCDSASVSAFTPSQMADIANLHWDGTHTNYVINGDAAFVGDNLYLVMNEGGARDEAANNPIRLWWTNRWASPTGMPCGPSNSGEQVIADDVVYYCSRLRIGSEEAELYTGTIPRPWTKLYEWVKMDWGFGLRNLGGFLGWGAATGDRAYLDIAAERDPFWTQNSGDYLDGQTAYVRPNGKSEDNQNGDIKFF